MTKVQPKFVFSECKRTMAIVPFKLADIGEGIAEVELMKWFVKEGDKVKSFDRICEVQSDKATVEITSRFAGVIAKVHHDEGAIVKVGAALIDIETDGPADAGKTPAKATSAPVTSSSASAKTPACAAAKSVDNTVNNGKVLTTPAVRKIAKENNVNLSLVPGSGPKNRILKEDILNYIKDPAAAKSPAPAASAITPSSSSSAAEVAEDTRVPIRGVQRLMVKSMTASLAVPHLTYCEEITFDAVKSLREELKHVFAKQHNVKLSYMPLLLKATSLALKQFPHLNATVNADCTEMIYHANHNIGVAMDTPKGLIVPVVKAIQNKSILEIAQELQSLQDMASKGTLTEAHLSGGTFSLSNIGSIGGTYAVPVLVVPQVLIGAIGRLQVVPRYPQIKPSENLSKLPSSAVMPVPTTVMNVSWSADHRVVDGASVAKFSNLWKKYLEHPHLMLSELR